MRSARHILAGALLCTAASLPAAAAADNFYTCRTPDGVEMLTNVKRARGCKVLSRGSSKPVFSRQTYVRSGGRIERDWTQYDPIIKEASQRYNIPVYLLKAVIVTESSLDPFAVSSAGAEGLMQLMPGTANDMQVTDSFDPKENIMGGARYLRVLANLFDGDLVMMIAGYNAGHNAVIKSGRKIPNIAETRDYVRKVITQYYRFKKEYVSEQEKSAAKAEPGT